MKDKRSSRIALSQYDVLHNGPEDEFEQIVALARMMFSVPVAVIMLTDGTRISIKSQLGLSSDCLMLDHAFFDETLSSPGPLLVEDASRDARFRRHPLVTGLPGFRAFVSAPLRTPEGTPIGMIAVFDTVVREFYDLDSELLGQMARITVASLELRLISSKDTLTGAVSRRAFMDALGRELERQRRHDAQSALLVCRVDAVPPHGAAGADPDEDTLRAVADALRSGMRATDTLGRVAAGSFAVLLVDADTHEADIALARLRRAVAAARLDDRVANMGRAVASRRFASGGDWLAAADEQARSGYDHTRAPERGPVVTHRGIGTRWRN